MYKKTIFSVLFSVLCYSLLAQTPLSGTYTIAQTGGDFSSFNEAVDSLKANGISSSVTFNVASGTYDETFEIDSIGGTSETATISFVGEEVTSTIIEPSSSIAVPTLELSGCRYVHFQNLTINDDTNPTIDPHIFINNDSKEISFKNCIINAKTSSLMGVHIENVEGIAFDSCYFTGSASGVYRNIQIESSEQLSMTNCELKDGAFLAGVVRGITLINNRIIVESGVFMAACWLSKCRDYYFENNIIFDYSNQLSGLFITETATGNIGGHTTMPILKNNVFAGVRGLEIYLKDSIELIHNTCIGGFSGLRLIAEDSVGGQFYAENNLFAGNDFGALNVQGSFDSFKIDYNAYLTDTTLYHLIHIEEDNNTQSFSDFSLYQLAFPNQDQNSRFISPNYLAENDYHINSATEFHFGRNDLGITEDVEGDPRGLWGNTVDVGADEFAGYLTDIFELRGRLFLDENGNGIQDVDEYGLANRKVTQLTDDVSTLTDKNGDYYFYTIDGNSYTIQPETLTGFSISPVDSTIMAGAYHIDSINFAYQIVEDIPNVEVDFTTAFKRCFRTINAYITYENTGSVQDDITIVFTPSEFYTLESAEPAWDNEIDGTYYWEIEDLAIFESGLIRLQITMPGIETIGIEQTTLLSAENADSVLIEKTYTDEIACAYDPNDKQVFPAGLGDDNLVLKDETLEYLIRFQNTGNDTAFDIRIQDQLSADLDLSTFELVATSHDVRTELNTAINQLIFYYDNIQLVDSVANEPDSHGFVKYRIKAKEDILDSTVILNTAYIYFDFNPPIITNTVSSTMVDELPNGLITELPELPALDLNIYPNPTKGLLNIQLPNAKPVMLELTSLDGRLIHVHHYEGNTVQLDLNLLPAGIYLLNIMGEDYQIQKKVVVK